MKTRQGSALVLVLCVIGALSVLMLRIYWRASLLLQTVIEREQDVKMQYAAESLMLYACYMAKHNWDYVLNRAEQDGFAEHKFEWNIDEAQKASAICVYKGIDKDRLEVEVHLSLDAGRIMKITCELISERDGRVVIEGWKVG